MPTASTTIRRIAGSSAERQRPRKQSSEARDRRSTRQAKYARVVTNPAGIVRLERRIAVKPTILPIRTLSLRASTFQRDQSLAILPTIGSGWPPIWEMSGKTSFHAYECEKRTASGGKSTTLPWPAAIADWMDRYFGRIFLQRYFSSACNVVVLANVFRKCS